MEGFEVFGVVVRTIALLIALYGVWFLWFGAAISFGKATPHEGSEGKDYWTSGIVFALVGFSMLMQADKVVKIAYPWTMFRPCFAPEIAHDAYGDIEVTNATWFSVSKETALPCPSCGTLLEGCLPSVDHHPATCSSCKDSLVILSTSGHRGIAVSLTKSPVEVQRFFLMVALYAGRA